MSEINNSTYNPMNAYVTFTSIYGDDTMVRFKDVELVVNKRVTEAIMFGVKVGAASLTLIIMWMISKKRTTPIFIINQSSLVFTIIHASLYFGYLLSGFGSIVYNMTSFPQLISSNDVRVYAATNIFEVLLVASIEISLVFQVKVMFANNNGRRWTWCLMVVSIGMALATVGLYFATAVELIRAAYSNDTVSRHVFYNVSLILLASSVNLMTLMLVVKLVLAIRSRRFLGLKQFDSFHILLIMSCQTLIAPSILFILGWTLDPHTGNEVLITVGQLLIVLSLPLSSMWATTANNTSSSSSSVSCNDSSFGNDNLCSKSSQFRRTFMNRFRPKSVNGDGNSENTFVTIDDLEKSVFQELSTPVSGESKIDHDHASSISCQKTCNHVHASTVNSDKGSWSSDGSCGSSPLRKTSTVNSEDLPPHILSAYDDDRGIVESKKIILKKL
ncbi:ZYRO0F03300p [Zygosaccharomyces rouxii]|uniref:ZYRO0F03300p n=1 Tax=Zygosaccharomyces rouxii (strain ATCC 2623 / CBS 732 / NBRC 1130 / NCYC 568 / NRRL Y-229) TaxID=559307 RepID=C5DX97_ZYGRC|nr:uncharacterized protein ZYRO0F03300g [Zygosaccharomyces rouxii]KAH9199172.1 fungal pheromone mating factor STE2 GPCR-domain-containing protein [Zygosaccharomyces rouxii]CAR28408.1 ZYRO0F03300p [Zygosaccharomyces rouxii]